MEKKLQTTEVLDQITMLFCEDLDFRYNPTLGRVEYCTSNRDNWHALNENVLNSIGGALTQEFGDVYGPEFIRVALITETYQNAYNEGGLTHCEWMAENLLKRINSRLGDLYDFRYNITAQKIEYDEDKNGNWKVIPQYLLLTISNEISSYEIKYSLEEVRECLRNAPSIRYEEPIQ